MATYYFDAVNGSNSNGTGSLSNPWQFYDGKQASILAGDRALFKRGTLQIIDSLYLYFRSGTQAVPTYYGVYGEGNARVTWFCTNTWGHLFNGSNTSWVTIEDFNFNCSNQSGGSIYWAAQAAGSVTGIVLRRCSFYGSTVGTGLSFNKEIAATVGSITNCLVEDCDAYDNGAHGFAATGASNIIFRNCRAWENGARAVDGGHGFSARALRQTYTSGWSLVSGSIYTRPLNVNETDVYYVQTNGTYGRCYKNTTTPTTPALGEFGVSGGLLYLNIGVTPNGVSVGYAFWNCSGIIWEDCESFHNIWNQTAPYHEGHGFAFDDYTQDSIIRRCYSHDNEGLGISNNRGDRNIIESCLIVGNWQSGITAQASDDLLVRHNTLVNNNIGIGSHNGEIRFSSIYQRNHTVYNNHIKARTSGNTYGIDSEPLATNIVAKNNNILQCTTLTRVTTSIGNISVEPLLDQFYRPKTSSPLIQAGTYLGAVQDANSTTFQNLPSIGAYEYVRPRTAATTRTMRS